MYNALRTHYHINTKFCENERPLKLNNLLSPTAEGKQEGNLPSFPSR